MKKEDKGKFEKFYNSLHPVDRFYHENIMSVLNGLVSAFFVGATMKYVGPILKPQFTIEQVNAFLFGAGLTVFIDLQDYFIRHESLDKVLRDDPGKFLGLTAGYSLAQLLL